MTSRILKTAQLAVPFTLSYPQYMGSCMATASRAPSHVALRYCPDQAKNFHPLLCSTPCFNICRATI